MILLYRIFTTILYPFLFIFIYYRKILKKEDPVRFKEKILISSFKARKKGDNKLILFHAASLGEFKSIIPIIKQLNSTHRKLKFLITSNTLSSGNLAKIELDKFYNAEHRYIPFDVPFLIDKFLNLWKPDKIFLVDSEIWPNLILKAKKNKIPIALINARFTPKSSNRWMNFPSVTRKIFKIFDLFICSNIETKIFLEKLNLKNIYFKGNIKLADQIESKAIKNKNGNILINKRFWFAASTHKDEDLFCLKIHLRLREKFKDVTTIIAPRHIERSKEIKSLSEKLKLSTQILNKDEIILENKEVIIVNYFGALKGYFKYAKSVFIGKSMISKSINAGGQNPVEAAKLNCRIYHGPYVYNFKDIYEILEKNNFSKKINNQDELVEYLSEDLKNPKKKSDEGVNIINQIGQKTLTDTMILINNFLED